MFKTILFLKGSFFFFSDDETDFFEEEEAIKFINNNLDFLDDFSNRTLIGVAGTFTSIASIFLKQKNSDQTVN